MELAPRLYWVRLPLPMALDHINVYALLDDDGWTVVDTGLATAKTKAMWSALLDGPLSAAPLRRVLLTHHHPDHVGLAGWFQTEHGVELLATRTAWLFARMLTLDEQSAPPAETLAFWRAAGMPEAEVARRAEERPFNFADVVAPMPLGFTQIREGQRLDLGGRRWTVRLGQGHAPDHLLLFCEDGELVIAGDQYLRTISPNLGVYATEPEANPVADWLDSHRALRPHLTDTQLALPGHGLPFTGLPLRADQLIDNHVSALERLEAFLAEPHTAADCFATLYRREIGPGEYTLALVEAVAHCLSLWHTGRVTRTRRGDGAWVWQAAKDKGDG
ncbi:MAG: MBL fold metallo-hydrolase [Paracoccaceae bacterium]|nr:MBL fold metallo-hydrolase [Paracoccaceae bacterium]